MKGEEGGGDAVVEVGRGVLWYFIHEVFIIDSSGPSRPMFRSSSKNNKFLPLLQALGAGREGGPQGSGREGWAGPASNLQPRFPEGIFWPPSVACGNVRACEGGGTHTHTPKLFLHSDDCVISQSIMCACVTLLVSELRIHHIVEHRSLLLLKMLR